jgi:hypothetical protein
VYTGANISFRRFLRDVRREFMQHLSVVFRARILGSYRRDALQEGGAAAVACLPAPRR